MNSDTKNIKESLIKKRLKLFVDLTPGIVHNISNPLTVISTHSQLMQLKMPANTVFKKMVEQSNFIESLLNNIVYISQNITNEKPQAININTLVKNEVEFFMADAFFKHNIKKTFDYSPELVTVNNSYFHISILMVTIIQLLIHYFQNAEDTKIHFSTIRKNKSAVISISASVSGIIEEFEQLPINRIIDNESEIPQIQYLSDAVLIAKEVGINTIINRCDNKTEFRIEISNR